MSSCALGGITSMTVPATHDHILNAWLLAVLAARCSLYGCWTVGGKCQTARSLSTRSLSVSAM
ncbi:hypothetical protein BC831DRAFT_460276, partial [Entophlyctis helioformis]